jgi:hypothetical protein
LGVNRTGTWDEVPIFCKFIYDHQNDIMSLGTSGSQQSSHEIQQYGVVRQLGNGERLQETMWSASVMLDFLANITGFHILPDILAQFFPVALSSDAADHSFYPSMSCFMWGIMELFEDNLSHKLQNTQALVDLRVIP